MIDSFWVLTPDELMWIGFCYHLFYVILGLAELGVANVLSQ